MRREYEKQGAGYIIRVISDVQMVEFNTYPYNGMNCLVISAFNNGFCVASVANWVTSQEYKIAMLNACEAVKQKAGDFIRTALIAELLNMAD